MGCLPGWVRQCHQNKGRAQELWKAALPLHGSAHSPLLILWVHGTTLPKPPLNSFTQVLCLQREKQRGFRMCCGNKKAGTLTQPRNQSTHFVNETLISDVNLSTAQVHPQDYKTVTINGSLGKTQTNCKGNAVPTPEALMLKSMWGFLNKKKATVEMECVALTLMTKQRSPGCVPPLNSDKLL